MARRVENECAYCAEELECGQGIVGEDWKVYCSNHCVELGEIISRREMQRLMSVSTPRRDYTQPKQLA
ncbi:MAG: hypothetical protein AB7P14_25485 [Blastocatellales bacterium]